MSASGPRPVHGPGHNNGPTMEPGGAWRRHCWTTARRALLPQLPLEVVRRRVKRARELGLDYTTYATIRATTGHDVVALLFSTNALRLLRSQDTLPEPQRATLATVQGCERRLVVHRPLTPEAAMRLLTEGAGLVIAGAAAAPRPFAGFGEIATAMRVAAGPHPGDRVVLIGDTAEERGWTAPGRFAGYLPAERYFGPSA